MGKLCPTNTSVGMTGVLSGQKEPAHRTFQKQPFLLVVIEQK